MPSATITSKGQTTIPKRVREHLRLEAGDQIEFLIEDDGRVVLRPATVDLLSLAGRLRRSDRKAVSLEAMQKAIRSRGSRL
jgi:antitoxin PrlF